MCIVIINNQMVQMHTFNGYSFQNKTGNKTKTNKDYYKYYNTYFYLLILFFFLMKEILLIMINMALHAVSIVYQNP